MSLAQIKLSLGGDLTTEKQYNNISTTESSVSPIRVLKNTFRANIILWQNKNIGSGIGIHLISYRLGFSDNDPTYFNTSGHANMRAVNVPINIVYRKKLFDLFKRSMYMYGQFGCIIGFNSHALKNWDAISNTWRSNRQGTNFNYTYSLNYNFSPIYTKIDIGIRLDYQVLDSLSIGVQARYYQGLQKIGELSANYGLEGSVLRDINIKTVGSIFMFGGGILFHINT